MLKLSDNSDFRVKWAAPNLVQLDLHGKRCVISKKDLLLIFKEIGEFMNFYKADFSPSNINKPLGDYVDDISLD